MSELGRAAAALAAAGWPVHPLRPRAKVPATAHGCTDASCDAGAVDSWWRRWPSANIGVGTGAGFVVVDLDGAAAAAWAEENELPDTLTATTARGRHLYYALPPGVAVANSAGQVAEGVDIRGTGGYVVAPPSVHPSGAVYRWLDLDSGETPSRTLMTAAPDRLLAVLCDRSRRPVSAAGSERRAVAADAGKPGERFRLSVRSIPRRIPHGERHNYCWRFAASLRAQGVNPAEIHRIVWELMRRRADPVPAFSRQDIERVVEGVIRRYPAGPGRGFGGGR